jgi:hypothetical protein
MRRALLPARKLAVAPSAIRFTRLGRYTVTKSHHDVGGHLGRPPLRKKGAFTAAERQARRRKAEQSRYLQPVEIDNPGKYASGRKV